MNSLQLISKIKSKAEDISLNIHEILDPASTLHAIEKELIKKQCLDLYELILKLKTDADLTEEKSHVKFIIPAETPKPQVEAPPILNSPPPVMRAEEPAPQPAPEPQPVLVAENFKEVMNWADKNEETLDTIEQKVELADMEPPLVPPVEPKKEHIESPIEVNVEKATENKRIQYTVMPSMEESKPVPLNNTFFEKEATYNDKIAQKLQPNPIPLADKTIDARIDNLKTAISLNKKIAYVNELFKENVVEYAKAIDKLNNAAGVNEAMAIFTELKLNNQWQPGAELVQELEKLIKRRHS